MTPRSAKLLAALMAAKEFTAEELASHLLVPLATVQGYVAATMVMPLSRQLLLARFAIERSASQKRAGQALHAQVVAAIGFHARDTVSHSEPPSTWKRLRRP